MRPDPRKLLKFRPSSGARWDQCAVAPIVDARLSKWSPSIYAATGTGVMAHIERAIEDLADESYFDGLVGTTDQIEGFDVTYTQEDADAAKVCFREISTLEESGMSLEIEKDVHTLIPVGDTKIQIRGRLDFALVSDEQIVVVDYKHGVGHTVEAANNIQLLCYLLGAIREYGHRESYSMRIIQPRARTRAKSTTWDVSGSAVAGMTASLAASMLRAYDAALTLATEGGIPITAYSPGSHCKWCPIERGCPGRLNLAISAACVTGLPYDEGQNLQWMLENASMIRQTVSDAETRADEILLEGGRIDGWKLVESYGNRSLRKDLSEAEITALKAARLVRMEPKMPTIAALEKAEKTGKIKSAAQYLAAGQKKPKRVTWDTEGVLWGAGDEFGTAEVTATTEG